MKIQACFRHYIIVKKYKRLIVRLKALKARDEEEAELRKTKDPKKAKEIADDHYRVRQFS